MKNASSIGAQGGRNEDLVRLWMAVVVSFLLAGYWLAIHMIEPLRRFFAPVTWLPVADWLADGVYAWLVLTLWLANRRWRESIGRERQLDRILGSLSPGALLVVGPERTVSSCNRGVEAVFGREPAAVIGRTTDELYFDRRLNPQRHEVRDALDAVGFHVGYGMGRKPDGRTFPIELTTARLQGMEGAVVLVRDITECKQAEDELQRSRAELERRVEERTAELWRKNEELLREIGERQQAQESLRRSEARFRGLIEHIPAITYSVSLGESQATFFISPQIESMLGYTGADAQGDADFLYKRVHPEDRARVLERVGRQRAAGGALEEEYRVVGKDGRTVWLRDQATCVGAAEGRPAAVHGVMYDITALKEAERALRESEQNFRALAENAMGGILILSADGRIRYANPRAAAILAAPTAAALTDKQARELLLEPDWRNLMLTQPQTAGFRAGSGRRDGAMVRADGIKIPVDMAVAPTLWEGKPGHIVIFNDVTERKEAEALLLEGQSKLRYLASELSIAEESERRRIATSLHDGIGQILALCQMKLGSLPAGGGEQPPALTELRGLIADAIRETRLLTFQLSPPVLYELGLEAAIEWLSEQMAQQHGIPIRFTTDQQPKPLEDTMRVVLFQATRELVFNAVKHAQGSRIRVSCRRAGPSVHLTVEDDGRGFDVQEIDRRLQKDKGFGLFYIQERMRFLGGSVRIEAGAGRGTRVTLTAPVAAGRESTGRGSA